MMSTNSRGGPTDIGRRSGNVCLSFRSGSGEEECARSLARSIGRTVGQSVGPIATAAAFLESAAAHA